MMNQNQKTREATNRTSQRSPIIIDIVIKEKKMEKAMETDIETERKVTKTERRGPHRNGEAYKKKQKQLLLIRKYTACLNAQSLGPGHGGNITAEIQRRGRAPKYNKEHTCFFDNIVRFNLK